MSDLQSMSLTQMRDLERQIREAKKAVISVEHARLGTLLTDFVEDLATSRDLTQSESSDWVGYGENSIPVTVDGVAYTVSVTITHTAEKAKRTPTFKAAKDQADAKGLTGDERKKFIADALALVPTA